MLGADVIQNLINYYARHWQDICVNQYSLNNIKTTIYSVSGPWKKLTTPMPV